MTIEQNGNGEGQRGGETVWRERMQSVFLWAKAHKAKAFLLAAGGFIFIELLTIPWFGVATLRTENPDETALMRQRIREAENQEKPLAIKQKWIPISRIPRHVINAVIVAEDGTFWEHGGFDWYEFQQSLKKNWEKRRAVRGASTITQQLAKNLYLSTSKDPIRKLKEWLITLLLEGNLEKQRILEIYLNVIEWGRGVFGIESAAQIFFGRSANSLTYEQALRLAAVIPSPLKHKPTDYSRWVMYRRKVVAQRMLGRRYYESEPEPDEEEETEQEQPREFPSSPDTVSQPSGVGKTPVDDASKEETIPTEQRAREDSSDIEKDNTDDLPRRE